MLGKILKGYEQGKHTLSVFLDLSKAFDTISHEVLFQKLEIYGIRGVCLNWFRSYLSDRRMRVKCISDCGLACYSKWEHIEYGTPQGSVLGPLIFLIFNNDLHLHLSYSNCILFADDTTIYSSHKNLRHLTWCIREDLMTLCDWFKANKLTLNLDKSVALIFSNKRHMHRDPCLSELGLPIVTNTKFLGIRLDDNLHWTEQYHHVTVTIKRNMKMLHKISNILPPHAKKNLYYGHIYSHLSYCISTWGPMLQQSQIKKLQKLQNKCVNLIDNSSIALPHKFKKHRILHVREVIDLELAKIGYRLQKQELPVRILETLKTDSQSCTLKKIHKYETRYKTIQNKPRVSNKKYSSFLCESIRISKPLLAITKESNSIHQFTSKVKNKFFATSDNNV